MYDQVKEEFESALLALDRIKVKELLSSKSATNSFLETLENIVVPAMESIGEQWEKGEVALSQVYMGGKICEELVDELFPESKETRVNDINIGLLVYKDHHVLGKRVVYTFLKASGYDIMDYGPQHDVDEIISLIKKDNLQILLISTLMLNSALNIKELTKKIKDEGLHVKTIVGGAPFRFDKDLYLEVGADACATNAGNVIDEINKLKETL